MACIKPFENFDPVEDSKALEKAMKGIGTDEKAIIDILAHRSAAQRLEIMSTYKAQFGKDLLKELKSELSGRFEQAVLWSFNDRAHVNATALFKAIDRAGTDELMLIDVLCTATPAEIEEIKAAYLDVLELKKKKNRDLEKDIKGDTSGHFEKLLVVLLQACREDSCDEAQAKVDSFDLYQAGEARSGTDESAFTRILGNRSWEHLRKVDDFYVDHYGHNLIKAITKETSGDYRTALVRIMQTAANRDETVAEMFYNSMKGMGTNDDNLIRLILVHSETDLARIKDVFYTKYGKSLEDMVKGDTSGDYRKFLLAIVSQ
nr:annexin [Hymenolepis microstoma]